MDATLVALIALVVFIGLLVYLKVPGMVAGMLDRKSEAIRAELDEARRLREEAQSLLAEYQRKRRDAEKEADAIVAQARDDAEAMMHEASKQLEDMVARRERMAEQKIAQAEASALADVRNAAADAAIEAARKILGDSATGKTADDLFKKSLQDVKANLN